MLSPEMFEELDKLTAKAIEHDDLFSEWEQGFVNDFAEKLDKYERRTNVSPKQWDIFERIRDKLVKEGHLEART